MYFRITTIYFISMNHARIYKTKINQKLLKINELEFLFRQI
jgi:hypothetical protein